MIILTVQKILNRLIVLLFFIVGVWLIYLKHPDGWKSILVSVVLSILAIITENRFERAYEEVKKSGKPFYRRVRSKLKND
jgi:uncharacterized membrane protein